MSPSTAVPAARAAAVSACRPLTQGAAKYLAIQRSPPGRYPPSTSNGPILPWLQRPAHLEPRCLGTWNICAGGQSHSRAAGSRRQQWLEVTTCTGLTTGPVLASTDRRPTSTRAQHWSKAPPTLSVRPFPSPRRFKWLLLLLAGVPLLMTLDPDNRTEPASLSFSLTSLTASRPFLLLSCCAVLVLWTGPTPQSIEHEIVPLPEPISCFP